MTFRYRWTRGEPDLDEMLRDDVVQAVMRRDGVSTQDLDSLIRRVQRRLHDAAAPLPTAANDGGRPVL